MARRTFTLLLLLIGPGLVLAGSDQIAGKAPIRYGVFSEAIIPDGPQDSGFTAPGERGTQRPAMPGAGSTQPSGRYGVFSEAIIPDGAEGSGFRPPGAGVKLPPGPRCYTDMELMAEVSLRHIFQQESAARSCDPVLKLRDRGAERLMTRMHDEIVEKFAFNLEKYQQAHEARNKRWYGQHWERALELERQRAMRKFLKDLWLLPGTCANMRKELEIILNSGWHYLSSKLNFEAEELRPSSRMCKVGG